MAVAAAAFWFSRQSLYTAMAALREQGLAGLVPARPGHKAGHKLTESVVDHLEALVTVDPSTRPVDLVVVVAERFGVSVHPRSIGRALARRAEVRARQGAPKNALGCHDIGDVEYLAVQQELIGLCSRACDLSHAYHVAYERATEVRAAHAQREAARTAEMMAAFGALNADHQELIFTCSQMLLEEQHEDERAGKLAAHSSAGATD